MNAALVLLCCLLGLAVAADPTRPQISDVFYAKVSIAVKEGTSYWRGGGLYAFDVPQGRARIDVRLEGPSGTISNHILDRYDLNATYIIEDDKCTKKTVSGSLGNPWAWIATATFNGTSSFGGHSLDDWTAVVDGDTTLKVSVLSADTTKPVLFSEKYVNGSYIEQTDMTFLEFNTSTPEEWVFSIPSFCTKEKSLVGGNPGDTAYFANSQWDCANPTCSQRVPAGSGQPGYECAEFAARSLAYGGYIPGLTSGAPQGSYGNYKGHNLLLTTGLADCLAGLGFRKLPNSGSSVSAAVAVFGNAGDGTFSHACIGVGNNLIDCHNNARYQYPVSSIMYLGIDAVYGP